MRRGEVCERKGKQREHEGARTYTFRHAVINRGLQAFAHVCRFESDPSPLSQI